MYQFRQGGRIGRAGKREAGHLTAIAGREPHDCCIISWLQLVQGATRVVAAVMHVLCASVLLLLQAALLTASTERGALCASLHVSPNNTAAMRLLQVRELWGCGVAAQQSTGGNSIQWSGRPVDTMCVSCRRTDRQTDRLCQHVTSYTACKAKQLTRGNA